MPIKKQLTVSLGNKPGQLSKVCTALGRAKVNILAISVVAGVDIGSIRFVPDKVDAAKKALKKLGLFVTSRDVVSVTLPDKPGMLGKAADRLAKKGLNIDYVYGSVHKKSKDSLCIFGVSNSKKAQQILKA